jgi:hypothetical protein
MTTGSTSQTKIDGCFGFLPSSFISAALHSAGRVIVAGIMGNLPVFIEGD